MSVLGRIFKRVFIHSSKVMSTEPIFLNVLMTDVRQASVQKKLMSFYRIISCCLNEGRRVNVIVALGKKDSKNTELIYSDYLADYLQHEGFNLLFIKPATWRAGRLSALKYVVTYFAKLRGDFAQRLNFACLCALARVRIRIFQDIYDALPCSNWLGLTGGVELPAFKFRRDLVGAGPAISALQFGQASVEHQHFAGYNVDNFFVYDDLSAQVYWQLDMRVSHMLVVGSPEFEYHTGLLCSEKLLEEERLSVVFVDQPVQQRGEYSEEYLLACYAMLQALNNDPAISIKVKPHPRGSAFFGTAVTDFSVIEDWSEGLSRAHVVVGFFSNLCDLALRTGRITFYVGSEAVLDKNKRDWIVSQGGYVVDDIDSVWREILRLKSCYVGLANQIVGHATPASDLPSEIVYKKLVDCSDA
ncbi:hypothetical protein [Pseudomonas peli]|uniref:hypothetical protein n=1 Tax=Pseudomonas peli TaxID=592361 RepID=UPI003D312CEA